MVSSDKQNPEGSSCAPDTNKKGYKMMLKVLIADDEPRVGMLVKQLIHWQERELECVGMFQDGQRALEGIQQLHPDIVITDIRMPVLSGLELIEKALESNPQIRFVVISGYRYFEHAQRAIKYGVQDYLLKPIDEEELNRVLEKICAEKADQQNRQEHLARMENSFRNSRRLLDREVLQQLLAGRIPDVKTLNHNYGTDFVPGCFQAVVVKMDRAAGAEPNADTERFMMDKLRARIEKNLQGCKFLCCSERGRRFVLLFNYEAKARDVQAQILRRLLEDCRNYADNYDFYRICMGSSEESEAFSDCARLLRNAEHAMLRKLFEGGGMRLKSLPGEEDARQLEELWKTQQTVLENGMDLMQAQAVGDVVRQMFERAQEHRMAAWLYFEMVERITSLFAEWAASRELTLTAGWKERMQDDCENCQSLPVLCRCLCEGMQSELETLREQQLRQEDRPIRVAMEYVQKNYAQHITLEDVAAMSGFNATYFSDVFKRKSGKNFSDYLTEVRMTAAKELLRNTRKTIYEVAEAVGYKDAKYFSQQFTRYAGMKPTEYRKLYY